MSSGGTACSKPREIYEFLDAYVIGQDKAKKAALSAAVYNHYKRVQSGDDRPGEEGVELAESNIMAAGPDGLWQRRLLAQIAGPAAERAVRDRRCHRADRGLLRRRRRREHPRSSRSRRRIMTSRRPRRGLRLHRRDRQDRPQERESPDHPRRSWRGRAAGPAEDLWRAPLRRSCRRADASTRTRSSSRSTRPTSCSSAAGRSPGLRRSSSSVPGRQRDGRPTPSSRVRNANATSDQFRPTVMAGRPAGSSA